MGALSVVFVTCLVLVGATTPKHDLPERISNEVESLKTGKISSNLVELIKRVDLKGEFFCPVCEIVASQIISYRKGGAKKDSMVAFFQKLCRAITEWGAVGCDGYIDIEIDTVLYIIDNKEDLTPARFCGIYFQSNSCEDPQAKKWVVPIPPPNPHLNNHENLQGDDATPLKILHLTDFHFDPLYQAGSNSDCGLPLCCQSSNGPGPSPDKSAGFWGDYHVCDVPWYTVTNFTAYLTDSKEKYDWVYYTGDIISHRSWAINITSNEAAIKLLFQHFKATFKSTPVYAILGNHEPIPADFWSPKDIKPPYSTQWVFDLVAKEWSRWLPNNTVSTIQAGGYYTVLVRPKLRIIALNSNVCYIGNLWLIYEDEDPYGQLKWLVQVLTAAEKAGETVHILSHIPPGHNLCNQQWSNQFRMIVQRFAPIIAAHFNGHTHLDELRLFRDVNNTNKVVSVAFNAGSFTPFVSFNPNYRTYDVNSTTFRVLDYDHYIFNLTQANSNKDKPPQWYKLYSFKQAYGLKNVTNESLEDLLGRMGKNKTLVEQYFKFAGRESTPYLAKGCNDVCLKQVACSITAVETVEAIQCEQIKN